MSDETSHQPADKAPSPRRSGADRSGPNAAFRVRRTADPSQPILIVEDEFLIAADLEAQIRDDGGRMARIALSIEAAEDELRGAGEISSAILDVNVGGRTTFDLADALAQAGLPFVFFTGYRSIVIPDRFVGIPRIPKPATWRELKRALSTAQERILRTGLGSFRDSVEAALPVLRNRARNMAHSHEEADWLVERTLERAISAVGSRSLRLTIEDWLLSLLERTNAEKDGRMLH